jgi:predicted MFS family arabinose efflux permease
MAFLSPPKITTMEDARKHRKYALFILMIVYAFNFIDRQILNILQTPIKQELSLSDTQLGLLTGFSFTLVYITVGIAVAKLADSTNRKGVVTVSLAIWSGFTAVSGLAQNYVQLLLYRLGVGLGEAGGSPPSHAMLSDLYEAEKRGRALAIYSAGIYIGTMTGYIAGGWLSEAFHWRVAFFVVGLPGVALAVLMWFTMREPIRGLSGLSKKAVVNVTFFGAFARLWKLKSFRFFSFATGAGTFVTYGIGNWMVPYLERSHGWDRTEIGLLYGLAAGIFGAAGTIGGGYIADRLGAKDRRWFLWVPMWGKLLAGPFFIFGLLAPNGWLALAGYGLGLICASVYLGPSLAITHHLVPPSMRAMSSAVLFFILNLIGLGFGPLIVGNMSDMLNDATACMMNDAAVQMLQACPTVKSLTAAMVDQGLLAARTVPTMDAISGALAAGFDMRPLIEPRADFFGSTLGQVSTGIAAIGTLVLVGLLAMRRMNRTLGVFLIILLVIAYLLVAYFSGGLDYTFKQWAYGLRSAIPDISGLGIDHHGLRWAMVLAVVVTYPLCILWHWGAQALPTGELDSDGDSAADAVLTRSAGAPEPGKST